MLAKRARNPRPISRSLYALCSSLSPSRGRDVALVSIFARRFELWVWMVCPDISGLHSFFSVLAICDRVPRQPFDKVHLAHSSPRVFDKENPGTKFAYQVYHVTVDGVTLSCVIRDRVEVPCFRVSPAMVADCRDRIRRTVRRCPDNVRRTTTQRDDILSGEGTDVGAQRWLKLGIPIYRINFMSAFRKRICY